MMSTRSLIKQRQLIKSSLKRYHEINKSKSKLAFSRVLSSEASRKDNHEACAAKIAASTFLLALCSIAYSEKSIEYPTIQSWNTTTHCDAAMSQDWTSNAATNIRNVTIQKEITKSSPPRNVMLHRMRSVRARDMREKYKIDWKTVLGEGAYGSVHPGWVTKTGDKVSDCLPNL